MIPAVEEILRMLLQGQCSQEEALAWIDRHIELASASNELRDHFAGLSLQGMLGGQAPDLDERHYLAHRAYLMADEMLKAREA